MKNIEPERCWNCVLWPDFCYECPVIDATAEYTPTRIYPTEEAPF